MSSSTSSISGGSGTGTDKRNANAAIRYTLLRFALFAACFLAAWGLSYLGVVPAGVGDSQVFWVILLGLVLSAPLSWVLLRKQRLAMSEQVVEKVERAKQRLSADQSREDGADDAARAQG
ncbi:DUF4229 domain-containing protein [Streptomyces albus]|uniref:DUF4229 domain-containing protein n=1 Tax=Streptomyces albus TaxID=1888 RepID=UPI000AB2096E